MKVLRFFGFFAFGEIFFILMYLLYLVCGGLSFVVDFVLIVAYAKFFSQNDCGRAWAAVTLLLSSFVVAVARGLFGLESLLLDLVISGMLITGFTLFLYSLWSVLIPLQKKATVLGE